MLLKHGCRDVEGHGAPESVGRCVVGGVVVDLLELLFHVVEEGQSSVCPESE